jgi:hypothetical protein
VLAVYDVERRRVDRRFRMRDLGEIYTPTWSPDGRSIAFAGVSGGLTDLFVFEFEGERLRRVTNDPFSDLHPAWSPDGSRIAFTTDRFGTDLEQLEIGRYELAFLDVRTGRVSRVPGAPEGRHINPQWAPDGRALYFLADPAGVTNVFRLDLAAGTTEQMTSLFTGASGITETSPALSVAQRSGRVAYSVFQQDGYDIYSLELGARSVPPARLVATAAALPPLERARSSLLGLLENPTRGLPTGTGFQATDYSGGLGLTYIGQPTLVAGTSQFGTFIGGGISLYFSDILGNHNLATAVQATNEIEDLAAYVAYTNLKSRLNWGLAVQQQPYRVGGYALGESELDGEPVLVAQQLLERQINRDAVAFVAYPLSETQRVELSAGYSNISFDRELQTRAFSLNTGELVFDEEEELEAGEALDLGVGAAALVFDNSIFGATSPIAGGRYRFEVGGTLGSLDFVRALGDFRQYFLPVRPLTFAFRLLHYGRYGPDAEDPRLQPLFLGTEGLVRGYHYGSFDATECVPNVENPDSCPVFEQLLGSRLAVANAELRFPLLGIFGGGAGDYYGGFPIELALFGDAGLAWDSDNEPWFTADGGREPVFSAGAALRINLFGFAVAELNAAKPFDRPGKGLVWQLLLQPGF